MKVERLIHDFTADLRWSELPVQYVTYMQAVTHWWADATAWDRITDKAEQRKGKDISVTLPDGHLINIQFKSRRKCYADCSIEYRHDFKNGYSKPGWIELPSEADYLLYYVPGGKVAGFPDDFPRRIYRIDYPSLHAAWDLHKSVWLTRKDFFHPDAENPDYVTRNIAIPWDILEQAGVQMSRLDWDSGVEHVTMSGSEIMAHPVQRTLTPTMRQIPGLEDF